MTTSRGKPPHLDAGRFYETCGEDPTPTGVGRGHVRGQQASLTATAFTVR